MQRILDDSDLSDEEENRCPLVERVQIHAAPRDPPPPPSALVPPLIDSKALVEDTAMPLDLQPGGRRHSMPMPMRSKELHSALQQHRNSVPKVLEPRHVNRRHSLPTKTPLLNGTSIDKLTDKLSQVVEAGSLQGSNSTLNSTLENLVVAAAASVQPRLSDVELERILLKRLNGRRKSEPDRFPWRRASDTDFLIAQLNRVSARLGRPAWRDNNLSDIEHAAMVRNLFNRRGSNGSLRTHSSNLSSFGRQVLRPLSSNSRVAPLNTSNIQQQQFGSGNEGFVLSESASVAALGTRNSLTVDVIDRPRSLSLDARHADVQPQILQRLHEHISGGCEREVPSDL